jgi:hypothetical protein
MEWEHVTNSTLIKLFFFSLNTGGKDSNFSYEVSVGQCAPFTLPHVYNQLYIEYHKSQISADEKTHSTGKETAFDTGLM